METTLVDGQLRFMHGYRTSMEGTKKEEKGEWQFQIRGWKSEIQFAYCRSEMIYSRGPVADSFPLIYARPSKHGARLIPLSLYVPRYYRHNSPRFDATLL